MDPRGNMMIMTDPPRHTVLRRIVNKGFTPLAVRRMEPHIRELVTKILDDVIERGECDFVLDISRRLPLEVICEMVGVPDGDWEGMFDLTNRVIGFDDPEFSRDEVTAEEMQLSLNLFQYMGELITSRRTDPRDDVLSVLVNTEVDGETLNNGEIFLMFLLLISRRQRDDAERHLRRHARDDEQPGSETTAHRRTRTDPDGRGRDSPMDIAGYALRARRNQGR